MQMNLDRLWAGVIQHLNFDILQHTITFHIQTIDNDDVDHFILTFKGVSSYYFVEDSEEKRLHPIDPDEDAYLELTSIDYYENGVGQISIQSSSENNWVNNYFSSANFVLELWNSMLFIEAQIVTINDETFKVSVKLLPPC